MPPARRKTSKQLGRNPDADPVKLHRDYVERRIGGGEPPTAAAYQKALEQWHKLRGAVRQPGSELTAPGTIEDGPDGGPDVGPGPQEGAR
jgi:hypothetical protein